MVRGGVIQWLIHCTWSNLALIIPQVPLIPLSYTRIPWDTLYNHRPTKETRLGLGKRRLSLKRVSYLLSSDSTQLSQPCLPFTMALNRSWLARPGLRSNKCSCCLNTVTGAQSWHPASHRHRQQAQRSFVAIWMQLVLIYDVHIACR